MGIPKILHQIWFQGQQVLPEKYHPMRQTWLDLHPGWKQMFWDQPRMESLLQKPEYSWVYEAWKGFSLRIQKIDVFKCVALLEFGGVYSDMDTSCIRPLDSLLPPECTIAIGRYKKLYRTFARIIGMNLCVNNSFLASEPRHPFFKDFLQFVIKRYQSLKTVKQRQDVMSTTGPKILSQFVKSKAGSAHRPTLIDDTVVELYPHQLEKYQDTGYIVHHSEATWVNKKSLLHWFTPAEKNPEISLAIFVLLIVFAVILIAIVIFGIVKMWELLKKDCRL